MMKKEQQLVDGSRTVFSKFVTVSAKSQIKLRNRK